MSTTNETQIRERIQKWASSGRAKDFQRAIGYHATDILLFDVPNPLQSKGIDAYKHSWKDVFFPWYGEDGDIDVSELIITAGEDLAFCHGIINCSGTTQGRKEHFRIRLTLCLEKQNGQWTIVNEHHSDTCK